MRGQSCRYTVVLYQTYLMGWGRKKKEFCALGLLETTRKQIHFISDEQTHASKIRLSRDILAEPTKADKDSLN